MKNLNFNRYISLLKYSMLENKKTYLSTLAVGLLIFLFLSMMFAQLIPYGFNRADYHGVVMQDILDKTITISSLLFFIVIFLTATQQELVNRYCIQREGVQYNLLPATYLEKGFAIITVTIVVSLVSVLLFYLFTYTFFYLYFVFSNATVDYMPFYDFYDLNNMILSSVIASGDHIGLLSLQISILIFVPFALLFNLFYHFVIVTFFKRKAQLKAIAVEKVIENMFVWVFGAIVTFMATMDAEIMTKFFNFLRDISEALGVFLIDAFILMIVPLAIGFGYWFFRRLHYKELR
ncbi:MAG: hypothetical protein HUK05_05560 [Prevotella sp.]|nr:hypothetical protein [Prevotella sp.]